MKIGSVEYSHGAIVVFLRYAPDSQLLHSVTSLQNVLAVLGLFEDSHSGRT